jgi:hypothetical protein
MSKWKDLGDGDFTRVLPDGRSAKVFDDILWRVVVDDYIAQDLFFDHREAMNAVDAWADGKGELSFVPVERRWQNRGSDEYFRKCRMGEVTVKHQPCGNWNIDRVNEHCFTSAETARRYADERLP